MIWEESQEDCHKGTLYFAVEHVYFCLFREY